MVGALLVAAVEEVLGKLAAAAAGVLLGLAADVGVALDAAGGGPAGLLLAAAGGDGGGGFRDLGGLDWEWAWGFVGV